MRAELLRLLFADPERSHHLRNLARLSGLAIGTIQREVAKLKEAGLIREQREINPSTMSGESFRKKLHAGDAYITSVMSGRKLWIVGSDDELAAMA